MKKILLGLILTLGLIALIPFKSYAQSDGDYAKTFTSDITLNEDASIDVSETIDYHFDGYNHGIYREIPVDYKVSGMFKRPTLLYLQDLYYYETSNPSQTYSNYERSTKNGYVIYQIGDGDVSITGDYTFVISYKLVYAINYFDDHDELYINATGNGWEVPIKSVIVNITVPGEITDKLCYTGAVGTSDSECTYSNGTNTSFTTKAGPFEAYEGLTLAVKMPRGTIADTTSQQRLQSVLANLGFLLPIPIIVFLIVFVKKNNKNKKLTVIPNYKAPKELDVLAGGYIYKKNLPNNIITAQIIKFAIDGYIKIKQIGQKEYELVKTEKESPTDNSELLLYTGIFKDSDSVNLKKLDKNFYTIVVSVRSSIEKYLYQNDYFSDKQKQVKKICSSIGIIFIVLIIVLLNYITLNAAGSWAFGVILSAIAAIIASTQIDIRSEKGNGIFYELEGLKMYINTAEKHRIEFHNDPKKYSNIFETLLPYAMVFGLEKKWAKEFEDIYVEQPDWYDGDFNTFNSYIFVNTLSHMNQQVITHSNPPTSTYGFSSSHGASGGSGFSGGSSGGGFGGGGGGSW